MGYYNQRTHLQIAYYFFNIRIFNLFRSSTVAPKKGWNNGYQICEIERKS